MPELNPFESKRQKAILRTKRRKAVAQASDGMVPLENGSTKLTPKILAQRMVKADKLDKTQVRNLETLTFTTNKISDITDWLKRQVGRDDKNKGWGHERIGSDLMAALALLRNDAERIVSQLEPMDNDNDLPRQIHLDLCREYVKHLVAEFLYQKRPKE